MKAKSIKGKTAEEIEAALKNSMADGFQPTLAIVFISIKQDRKTVCEILHLRKMDVIGATSCGEFTDGFQSEGSIVILLMDLNRNYYRILFEDVGTRPLSDVAALLAQSAMGEFKRPAFILCSTGVSLTGEYFSGELKKLWDREFVFSAVWRETTPVSPVHMFLRMITQQTWELSPLYWMRTILASMASQFPAGSRLEQRKQ